MSDDVLRYFDAEKAKHLAAAKAVTDGAKEEGRGLSDTEREVVEREMSAATEWHGKAEERKSLNEMNEAMEQLGETLASEPPERIPAGKARTYGEAFVNSEAYKALMARGTSSKFSTTPIEMPRFGATAGIVTEGTGDNGDMFLPNRIPGIQLPVEAPLAIADLFGSGIISNGNTALLVREKVSATVNGAATVAEGAPKPPSTIEFETDTATLHKIATTIKVSTEMLEDEAAIRSYLSSRLATFVRQEEEDQLVTQLISQHDTDADETDVDGDNLFDAILAGAVKVRTEGGLDADAVVMTALDWAKLLVEKNSSTGSYYSGGPFSGAGQLLWGRYRVAISERIGAGVIYVGAFAQGGTVWRKNTGVTVDATNSNEDDFLNNLTAIRAEERLALFLQRPAAFCEVTLGS